MRHLLFALSGLNVFVTPVTVIGLTLRVTGARTYSDRVKSMIQLTRQVAPSS